ncbi:MAG TPA: ABC transporter substrate-binding protein [Actinotalea sp.]
MQAGGVLRSRRAPGARVLTAALLLTSVALASGCTSPAPTVPTGGDDQVEVVTWWASGSEKGALDSLVGVFQQQYPETRFVDAAIAGGAGTAAKDLLLSRLRNGDPPDTFQVHGGGELREHVESHRVQSLAALYTELGLADVLPASIVDLVSVDGVPYAIPADVHRANVLWTNPTVLREAGLDPTGTYATLDDWFVVLDALQEQGQTPLALGSTWTQVHLLEQVLLARLGPAAYVGLWDGSTDPTSAAVTGAIADFARLLSYTNADRDRLDWQDTTQRVIDGHAAFTVMGDWALVPFEQSGMTSPADLVWSPVPGTQGTFDAVVDAFALPVGAPHPDSAKEWLRTVASVEGQATLSQAKGSLPPRTDVEPIGSYQHDALRSFRDDTVVPSITHGTASDPATLDAVMTAVHRFTTGATGPKAFQAELADAL